MEEPMIRRTGTSERERGAVLVHAAFAILAMTALTTFVIDYGVFWLGRRQAQNAADAGAMAAANALAFDDPQDLTSTGIAAMTGEAVARRNLVFGAQPSVNAPTDVTIRSGVGQCPAPNTDGACVTVDVYRTVARGNPLPMFIGQLIGWTNQDVRATATAQLMVANATDCLKPWAVIDRWQENYPAVAPWTLASVYNKYYTNGPNAGYPNPAIAPPDNYIAPSANSTGTGFYPYNPDGSFSPDYGMQFHLKVGDRQDFDFATGWFAALALPNSVGGSDYKANIKGCVGVTYKVGDNLAFNTEPGEKVGPTRQAVETDADSIVNSDPGAYWDPTMLSGRGGVAGSAFPVSPRIVAVPLVNPDLMAEANRGGRTTVPIANIMGFFVEGYDSPNKAVVGRLMTLPGAMVSGGTPLGGQSAFLQTIMLVR
jgi:Flp pilus assembly protein TadG